MAGTQPFGCSEGTGFNEIYLGNCPNGSQIHSGLRYHHLPVNQGEWISGARLVMQTDGFYDNQIEVEVRGEYNTMPDTFGPGSMPSDRLETPTEASVPWTISDPWHWRQTHESPELREIIQEIVDLDWVRSTSKLALIVSGAESGPTIHRRFMATERDPINIDPSLYPARLFVTQFRTRYPGNNVFYGNNRPIADAGPTRFYDGWGEKITLDGSRSFDPDDDGISHVWSQTGGPTVTLNGWNTATPWFIVPAFGPYYTFELEVTDTGTGQLQSTSSVAVLPDTCIPPIC